MTYRNLMIPLAFAVSITACGNTDDSASTQASSSAASPTGTCLQRHSSKLDRLLTKHDIAPYAQDAAEDVTAEYDRKYTREIAYSWPSDRNRTMSVSGTTVTIPVSNVISLGGIKTYTKDDYYDGEHNDPIKRFQRAHHNLTAEERAKARAAIHKEMAKKDKGTRKIANAMFGAASPKIMFEPVADVGDVAAWDLHAKALDVLTGTTEFSVHADVSAESDKNKAVAKTLAQSILADCTGGT